MSACAGTGPLGAPVKFQRSERGVTVGSISPSVLSAQYRAVFIGGLGIYFYRLSLCMVDVPDVASFHRFAPEVFIALTERKGVFYCLFCMTAVCS